MSYPNGTAVDYTYNGGTGWLSQVAHQKDGAANPFLSLTYTRNGIGLIKGVSESANGAATGSWAYDYDGLKRLTAATWTPSAGSPTLYGYTYDRNGNRRSYDVTGSARRHYVYNELDQLREERLGATLGASTLDKSYTWDKYGRMGSETASGGSPTVARQYKWTVDDRLVSVVLGDNPSNDPVIKYAYDHLGTRVSRSALGETAKHLTDYENPSGYSQTLAEVEGDGLNVLKNYFYGLEYGPLAQRGTTADSLAFLHGDHLQTTRQLTDSDGDVLLASSQKYEPFGTPTPDGLSSLTSYAFTGQSRDLDTGLQYHRARWLNTNQGRWLSEDPVWDFPGNFGSGYGYGGGSTPNWSDIAGLLTTSELLLVAFFAGNLTLLAFSIANFIKEPTWAGGAWLLLEIILTVVPGGLLLKWANRGISISTKALRAESAAKFLVVVAKEGNESRGVLWEAWVQARLLAGKIPGFGKVKAVSTTYVQGSASVGNDLMVIENGAPKVIEVTTNTARNFGNDVLEFKGIAKRFQKLVEKNPEAVQELRELGIDERFLNPKEMEEIMRMIDTGEELPSWFTRMERYVIVPKAGGDLSPAVPEGVEIIFVE